MVKNKKNRSKVAAKAPKQARESKASLSQARGGIGYTNTNTRFDISSTSLGAPKVPVEISSAPGRGLLGIQGTSGNWYLDSLVDPTRPPVRMPDTYSKKTAVHKSILYGTVTPKTTSEPSFGTSSPCFSLTLNPYVGKAGPANINDTILTICTGDGTTGLTNTLVNDPDLATIAPLVVEMRPVSAMIYVSFVGDTLNNGGQIAAAFMPSGSLTMNRVDPFVTNGGVPLRNMANLSVQPEAYSGPVRDGVYARWQPEDERDSFFYEISAGGGANLYNYPKLVVSGITTQSAPSIRYIVHVNWEFTTQSRIFPIFPSPINSKMIEHAKRCLQNAPYITSNDDHASIWDRFLNWSRGAISSIESVWNNDIKPIAKPIVGTVGKVADVLGFPEIGVPLSSFGNML